MKLNRAPSRPPEMKMLHMLVFKKIYFTKHHEPRGAQPAGTDVWL